MQDHGLQTGSKGSGKQIPVPKNIECSVKDKRNVR